MKSLFYIAGPYIVVATGWDEDITNYTNAVQLVNMDLSPSECDSLPAYPIRMYLASVGFLKNHLVICGGGSLNGEYGPYNTCYRYETADHKWTFFVNMQTERYDHGVATLPDGSMWITGILALSLTVCLGAGLTEK